VAGSSSARLTDHTLRSRDLNDARPVIMRKDGYAGDQSATTVVALRAVPDR